MVNSYWSLLITPTLLLIGAGLTTMASLVFGNAWLMPVLGALVIYPLFLLQVRRCRYSQGLRWVLIWAIFQSLAVILATIITPEKASAVVLSGPSYTEEMLHWIRTGEGAEGSLSLFLPLHVRQYAIFSFLSLITLGSASLLLGTYLLNYMNFYVGQLIIMSANPWLAAIIGWPIWSVLRVMGFICTGIALTALGLNLLARIRKQMPQHYLPMNYLLLGISFVVADIIVKATLAPIWQRMLLTALVGY